MITAKSNIEFLTQYNKWRRGDELVQPPNPKDLGLNIDYAIEILKMVETLNIDTWGADAKVK